MTDEQMDARLRRAGEAWRAAETAPVDSTIVTDPLPVGPPAASRRTRRASLLLTAAVVAAALAIGGGLLVANLGNGDRHRTSVGTEVTGVEGTVWRLVSYGDDPPRTGSLTTLYISQQGQLVADDGCTLIGGHADVRDGRIGISGDFTPRFYGCTDTVGDLTLDRALDILTAFPAYSIAGDELTISSDGATMHLRAAPELAVPSPDMPTFLGADWQLVQVTDPNGTAHPVLSGRAMLTVRAGQLTAGDTCNTLSGSVGVDGDTVESKGLATTEIGCPQDVLAIANVVDQVLAGPFTYRTTGTQLTVTKDGSGTLTYSWLPSNPIATDPANVVDRTWHLVAVAGQKAAGAATLHFDGPDSLTANDGCQDFTADARLDHGSVTLRGVPGDRPAECSGPIADQASTIDSFLEQNPALWSIRDGKLVVFGGGAQGFSLVYETPGSISSPPLSPLVGTTWTLNGIETDNGNSGSAHGSSAMADIQLRFDGTGHVTITHRCYVNKGDVEIGTDTLAITHVDLASAIPCPMSPDRDTEQQDDATVDDILSGNPTWTLAQGRLQISKGRTSLDFIA